MNAMYMGTNGHLVNFQSNVLKHLDCILDRQERALVPVVLVNLNNRAK